MPDCSKPAEVARIFLLTTVLALTACNGPDAGNRFEFTRVESNWANGFLHVKFEQQLELSDEARNALIHGVPLTLELDLVLRNTGNQTRVGRETRNYEIRYLPLSDYYQLSLSGAGPVKTFPRLRHVLAELSSLELDVETGVVPKGDYELLTRLRLDQHRMPPPMRLPVLLSSNWRHYSSWSSWPVQIVPGA